MTLPFRYVNQLERGKGTPLGEKWLKKVKQTLRQAETKLVRSILVWCLGDVNVNSVFWQSTPKENQIFSSQFMYQINMKKSMCYVSSSQINEIIGKELLVDGEWHSLSNLSTGWLVTLSHGAKKKDKQDCKEIKEEKINFSVGELVVVMNHGDAWTHCAHIISLNLNENAAMIKWESTGKSNYVEITDLKKNLEVETSQRK